MGRLQDKVCIITGATGGQGQVAVELFAAEGAKIVASDLGDDGPSVLASAMKAHEGNVLYVPADVTVEDDLQRIVKTALDAFGRIDVLYNNHGAMVGAPFLSHTMEELDLVLNVNVRATFGLTQLAALQMADQGDGGSIINISSTGGLVGFDSMAGYGASKAGVAQLARCLANDLKQHKIRVNSIAPGAIDTPMPLKYLENLDIAKDDFFKAVGDAHLVGRIGRSDEVVHLAVFLASDESSFTNGAVIPVDGGYTAV